MKKQKMNENRNEVTGRSEYESGMKKYIEMKIKKSFSHLPFHKCELCNNSFWCSERQNCFYINPPNKRFVDYKAQVRFDVDNGILLLQCIIQVLFDEFIICRYDGYVIKSCADTTRLKNHIFIFDKNKTHQIENIIAYKNSMDNLFGELCYKMQNTDELIILQKQYYTFLLSSRKTFPRDIRILISKKILFFKIEKQKEKIEKNKYKQMIRLKEELSKYEKDMKLYIMAKIKNRFNNIKFHRCTNCITNNVKIHDCVDYIDCLLQSNCEVNDGYLTLKLHSQINNSGKMIPHSRSFDYCLKKKCDGYRCEPMENIQAQKIIDNRKEITDTFTDLCYKMYYTDELILLQKQYYTFLLSSRKTFYRDISKIIANKIIFFLLQKIENEKV